MDAVTSYSTLKAAIPGMLKRDGDVQITENVALFIQLCESDFYDRLLLRDEESETSLTATTSQATIPLPSDFIAEIQLWLIVDGQRGAPLQKVQPQQLPYYTEDGIPSMWAIDGANVRFDCPSDSAYSVPFRYRRKTVLSDASPTNYLLLRRPDLYLYGSLVQAAMFTEDDAALSKYSTLYDTALRSASNQEARNRRVKMRTDFPGTLGRTNILTGD